MFFKKLFSGSKEPQDAKEELKNLIRQGIVYEEEFITMYMKLLGESEFLPFFQKNEEKAEEFFYHLLKESELHRDDLKRILANLK